MDWNSKFEAKHFLNRIRQTKKTFTAGIGIIGLHHGSQLIIAHGIGAAVGEHIEKYIAGSQKKCVIPGILNGRYSLGGGRQAGLLDNFDLVHLDRDYFSSG